MISHSSSAIPAIPESLRELAVSAETSGLTAERAAGLLGCVTEAPETWRELGELKANIGPIGSEARFERLMLYWAGVRHLDRLASEPVPASVKVLWNQEWAWMTQTAADQAIGLGSVGFVGAAKIATLRRFPAGPMDWESSGIPRSWLLQTERKVDALRMSSFIMNELGGFKPFLFLHVARKPKNRLLILEAEVMRMYHRAARALEMQPQFRGVLAHAWFHDPRALADNPHLEWLNRPYRDAGGLLVNLAPAGEDSGVTEGNAARKKSLAEGALQYRMGFAAWPRRAAIAWAKAHPEWDDPA